MTGFESYSPLKWLVDGALAVHLSQPFARVVKAAASTRSGRWASRAIVAAAVAAASVSSPAFIDGLPTGTSRPTAVQLSLDLPPPAFEGTPAQRRIAELRSHLAGLRSQVRRGVYALAPEQQELAESAAVASATPLPADWAKRLARSFESA